MATRTTFPILVKLLVAYVAPTLVLFAAFGWFAYDLARRQLEEELGRRLSSLAAATATQIRGKYLMELAPGDEEERAYLNTLRLLNEVRAETGVARMYVFRPDHGTLVDTRPGARVGDTLYHLEVDEHELAGVFREGHAMSSVLFEGPDGTKYKAGYAAVRASETDHAIVAAVAAEAPAAYFARLEELETRIFQGGALLAAVVIVTSVVVAAIITRPVRTLAAAATAIGRGDLDAPVRVTGHDEIAILARTLDEMREALRARDQRLRMMLAGIAHEVRNPLGGMGLYTGILRDEMSDRPEALGHLARVDKELGHLERVVSDFLEYARRPAVDLVRVELAPLMEEIRELCEAEAGGVRVAVDAPAGVAVMADGTQLRRALINLARNAVQAAPGGSVRLGARVDGRRVLVTVTDDGKGIDAATLSKIFDPFFTTKEKGTGLGLAFVKEIVDDHDGTLEVESSPGAGTTFTIGLRSA